MSAKQSPALTRGRGINQKTVERVNVHYRDIDLTVNTGFCWFCDFLRDFTVCTFHKADTLPDAPECEFTTNGGAI